MNRVSVVIVAGGSGSRMGSSVPKQFLTLEGDAPQASPPVGAAPLPIPLAGTADSSAGETVSRGGMTPGSASTDPGRRKQGGKLFHSEVAAYGTDAWESPQAADTENGVGMTPGSAFTDPGRKEEGQKPLHSEVGLYPEDTDDRKDAPEEQGNADENATILEITLQQFLDALPGCEIVVVLPAGEIRRWERICAARGLEGSHRICAGGNTRFDSVRNGIRTLAPCDFIAVHDGVRPLVTAELILRCVAAAEHHGTAIPAIQPVDSFRTVEGSVSRIIDRSLLRAVQTPQVFRADLLRNAYETAYNPAFTDDASVVESAGTTVMLCEGDRNNIKITTRHDLAIARAILQERTRSKKL